jgi:DNA-binding response OmpR family regulator
VERGSVDLVLLDLGLPDIDGIDVCRRLRSARPELVIVMLTARTQEVDVVAGLDAGADDYLTKPFRLAELLARVRAHLRRPRTSLIMGDTPVTSVRVGGLHVDTASRRAAIGDREVGLRAKEFDLLAMLASNAGRAMTREHIMTEVWDEHWFGSTKTLDMHISALRRKLGDPPPVIITTLRGVGYRMEIP